MNPKGAIPQKTKINRFQDLECWQQATSLATEVYRISADGEIGRDFGFRDQLRRSAVSIASNIAEGKERETASEFIRFLYLTFATVFKKCLSINELDSSFCST